MPVPDRDLTDVPAALVRLVDRLADLRPLLACARAQVAIAGGALAPERLAPLLAAVSEALRIPALVPGTPGAGDTNLVEHVVNDRLREPLAGLQALARLAPAAFAAWVAALPAWVERHLAAAHRRGIATSRLASADGTPLTVFHTPARHARTVILALPCATPFQIARAWFRVLGAHYDVVTWETRVVLDGQPVPADARLDLAAQSDDLLAVMERFGGERPHVMGICGGAVVALHAAGRAPGRFGGLSLWYGDYNFGDAALQTEYQRNLRWMMETAGADAESAQTIYELFNDKEVLKGLHPEYAPAILCPYAHPEALQAFGRLNGAIMEADVPSLLAAVAMDVSVVSGENDRTAHPGGSRRVACLLRRSTLHMRSQGDHLSFFDADEETRRIALGCIARGFEAGVPAGVAAC